MILWRRDLLHRHVVQLHDAPAQHRHLLRRHRAQRHRFLQLQEDRDTGHQLDPLLFETMDVMREEEE